MSIYKKSFAFFSHRCLIASAFISRTYTEAKMISKVSHRNSIRRWLVWVCCCLFVAAAGFAGTPEKLYTPLEQSNYRRLTGTKDRSKYLEKLSKYSSKQISVQHRILGKTVKQLPIEALLITCPENENQKKGKKLRVMLLASQHGSEISGCEALLAMAGNWVSGPNPSEWMKKWKSWSSRLSIRTAFKTTKGLIPKGSM